MQRFAAQGAGKESCGEATASTRLWRAEDSSFSPWFLTPEFQNAREGKRLAPVHPEFLEQILSDGRLEEAAWKETREAERTVC